MIVSFLLTVHVLLPLIYYVLMKWVAERKKWDLFIDENYEPKVTVIVPTYNEANNIISKLQNLEKLNYPKEKLEVIIVDSASTDRTADMVRRYLEVHRLPFETVLIEESDRRGKAKALNHALQYASNDLIATSDADCIWVADSLSGVVKYMSDPTVAAVCGHEMLLAPQKSSATRTENYYRKIFNRIRLGESKIHSTIAFEGGLAVYKKSLLEKFDELCDDSHSAFKLVQKGFRTILVPDAFFLNPFPSDWNQKNKKKIRRAQHLVEIWWRCLKLDMKRKLRLHAWIARINVFLHILNPILFPFVILALFITMLKYPVLALAVVPILAIPRTREMLTLYVTNNLVLLFAILREVKGQKQIVWEK